MVEKKPYSQNLEKRRIFHWLLPLLFAAILLPAIAGCENQDREGICIEKARQENEQLREAVTALLPPLEGALIQENNDCDSSDNGAWLSLELDRSVSAEKILRKFYSNEWSSIQFPIDGCSECVAGASRAINNRTIEITVRDRPKSQNLEVNIQYQDF